jgi:hypothetical protein
MLIHSPLPRHLPVIHSCFVWQSSSHLLQALQPDLYRLPVFIDCIFVAHSRRWILRV